MRAGRFISLEGGEGAGKTTAVGLVRDWLLERGREVTLTREPGGTPVAERVRDILLDPATGELAPMTELLLMFAARSENLASVIRPALESGQDVVCDRFSDASLAYQGGGREMGYDPVASLRALVHPGLEPDLTLLLDVPVEIGMARIRGRATGPDRFEQTRRGFLERVRQAYLEQARREPGRIALIDASLPVDSVGQQILQALEERLT